MKILVLGLGKSNQAVFSHLWEKGDEVLAVDRKFAMPRHPYYPDDHVFESFDFDQVVVSPGISKEHPIYQKALERRVEVVGEMELALREVEGPCIGITGTNGKTSVVSMVTHVLNRCGHNAHAVGNIGRPLIGSKEKGIHVVELSSFQLETMTTRAFEVGAILNITPDHLDRYDSFEAYRETKLRLCDLVQGECFFGRDWTNEEYAFALVQSFGVEREEFDTAMRTFERIEHRLEFVKEVDGISYYNDSKGTNVASVTFATSQMSGSTLLLAGGVHKGERYTSWKKPFQGCIRHLFAFGEAAPLIASDLEEQVAVTVVKTLDDAFVLAKNMARPGEAVLLSPGCSSFDQFQSFEERGKRFKDLVNE